MRPWIILIAALTYVTHMTFGCCYGHDHSTPAKQSQAKTCCAHQHLCGSHSDDGAVPTDEPSQPCGDAPHDHPGHDDVCVSTVVIAAMVVVKDALDSAVCLLVSMPPAIEPAAICTCSDKSQLGIDPTPHVRAHLAKSVITI